MTLLMLEIKEEIRTMDAVPKRQTGTMYPIIQPFLAWYAQLPQDQQIMLCESLRTWLNQSQQPLPPPSRPSPQHLASRSRPSPHFGGSSSAPAGPRSGSHGIPAGTIVQ